MALTSSAEHPQPLRAVVAATKAWVERLGAVWVEAQVIEIKRRAAPVQFLTLRDPVENISVSVTTTAAVLDAAGPLPEGTVVAAWIKPQVWAASGRLSFECRQLRPMGEGRLLAAIEQRKRMLQAEGLFDPALKRPLPFLPRVIGLVTGAGSAAERDVLENVRRRWPAAVFDVRHTLVQGPEAASQVAEAVRALDAEPRVDVIIVARGGGSLEDLLPFSDEALARTVFAARTPVVSAIGHESDTPILDLVADWRASTPTDAAKRVVPDAAAERQQLRLDARRLRSAVSARLDAEAQWLLAVRSRPVIRDPAAGVDVHAEQVRQLAARARRSILLALSHESDHVGHALAQVRALSPSSTLARGYAILSKGDTTLSSVAGVKPGDAVGAVLADGRLEFDVTAVRKSAQSKAKTARPRAANQSKGSR
ncbi:MAG: exodeoxyribonuclease VII large subunit [Propionibacteriaceae bacterium]|jgi:exodeoxyribonuclease VII large subunit|nr:exodeoxyribonuclease VII large subunit [Propionibacteriaceae bacterium]